MTVPFVPAVFAVLGLLIYALSSNGKAAEIGRIMFFCGLLAALFAMGGRAFRLPAG